MTININRVICTPEQDGVSEKVIGYIVGFSDKKKINHALAFYIAFMIG